MHRHFGPVAVVALVAAVIVGWVAVRGVSWTESADGDASIDPPAMLALPDGAERSVGALASAPVDARAASRVPEVSMDDDELGGRVIDASGEPVAGAIVASAPPFSALPPDLRGDGEAQSDADGRFRFLPAKTASSYRLFVLAKGRGSAAIDGMLPGVAVDVTLERPVVVKGTVLGADGLPIKDARVSFLGASVRGLVVVSTTTDAEGAYVLADVPACLHRDREFDPLGWIEASAGDGMAPCRSVLRSWWGTDRSLTFHFEVGRGFSMRALVLDDETGSPVQDVDVVARWEIDGLDPPAAILVAAAFPPRIAVARTDEHGITTLRGLPAGHALGPYRIEAVADRVAPGVYAEQRTDTRGRDGGTVRATVRLRRVASLRGGRPPSDVADDRPAIEGRAELPDGRPAVGARVAGDRASCLSTEPLAVTDVRGAFRWIRGRYGTDTLVATMPGYASATAEVLESRDGPLVIRLQASRTVRGRVRFQDGQPGYGLKVMAGVPTGSEEREDVPPILRAFASKVTTYTNEDGAFFASDLPEGPIEIVAACTYYRGGYEGWRASVKGTSATEEQTLDLVLPWSPLPNAASDQAPRRDVVVTFEHPSGRPWPLTAINATLAHEDERDDDKPVRGFTETPGRLVFRGLVPGTYALSAYGMGFAPFSRSVEVSDASETTEITVRPSAGGAIRATVVSPVSVALEDVEIEWARDDGGVADTDGVVDDAIVTTGLLPGRRRVVASVLGHKDLVLDAPLMVDVPAEGTLPVELRFVRGAVVRAVVHLVTTHAPAESDATKTEQSWPEAVCVEALGDYGRVVAFPPLAKRCTMDVEPEFLCEGVDEVVEASLAPGRWILRATSRGGESVETSIVVAAGIAVEATLRVGPATQR